MQSLPFLDACLPHPRPRTPISTRRWFIIALNTALVCKGHSIHDLQRKEVRHGATMHCCWLPALQGVLETQVSIGTPMLWESWNLKCVVPPWA